MDFTNQTTVDDATRTVVLSWARLDIEQRMGFRGARFTRVNSLLSFLLGLAITVVFFLALLPLSRTNFTAMFTERGLIPYFIVLLSSWALSILFIKSRKLRLQQAALKLTVVPEEHDFVLSAMTVDQVLEAIFLAVDDPKQFVLFNRIAMSLANLRNLGQVSDVDVMLKSQGEHDESVVETSYSLLRGFIWAIPVLGFIGTVLGLSEAIGGFGAILGDSQDISQITGSLKGVTSGLSTAFETTLQALVAALAIQIMYVFLKKSEEEFLDACTEYCQRHVVGRLRVMPFEDRNI